MKKFIPIILYMIIGLVLWIILLLLFGLVLGTELYVGLIATGIAFFATKYIVPVITNKILK